MWLSKDFHRCSLRRIFPPYIYGELKREELVRTGSVVLHDHYFGNLGGDGKVSGKALDLIKQWFGSYEQWEMEFKKTANSLGGGSGWTILSYNLHSGEVHRHLTDAPCEPATSTELDACTKANYVKRRHRILRREIAG